MPQGSAVTVDTAAIAPEDELRAQGYRLLSHFLTAPPSKADLSAGAGLTGDEGALGRAIAGFATLCSKTSEAAVAEEYQELFLGVGRGELVPYGSYYMTGFLHEKPLAKLRQDMDRLGLQRDPEAKEPEDHVASVLEMMAGFIDGSYGTPASLEQQKQFYDTHLGPWMQTFFRDLEGAKASVLYATLGSVGRAFIEIEETAFEMV